MFPLSIDIYDLDKLYDKGCIGSPDWIVEIPSLAIQRKRLMRSFLCTKKMV
jgi:hypothetical protein